MFVYIRQLYIITLVTDSHSCKITDINLLLQSYSTDTPQHKEYHLPRPNKSFLIYCSVSFLAVILTSLFTQWTVDLDTSVIEVAAR